jgi:hypothetical protein
MGKIGMDHPLSPAGPSVSSSSNEIKKIPVGETPATRTQPETIASFSLDALVPTPKIKNVSNLPNKQEKARPEPAGKIDSESFPPVPKTGASGKSEYTRLADEIGIRHYSLKTLKTYRGWVRKFQVFTQSNPPALLSTDNVKEFLTSLTVKNKVSSTTQNQAFNSLLFFYRHVLGKEFGKIDGVVRAKRRPCIPVVLSREEIDAVLRRLPPPYDLVVKLLYGCGLRLFECLGLRVHCMNFDAGIITVHDGGLLACLDNGVPVFLP